MTTLGERLANAARALENVTETPRLDAEILLAHALGIPRASLLARLRESREAPEFESMLSRRLAHEPIAYILGEWEFFGLQLTVEPPLLVPRPETEHLVEVVLEFAGQRPARVLDLCTGTGCVAVAVAHNAPKAQVLATDVNSHALAVATANAARHGVSDRIVFAQGDLLAALNRDEPQFDVVCANPPYVEDGAWDGLPPVIRLHEDRGALLAGPDGLDIVRRLASEAMAYLRSGGLLAFEIGMGQYEAVCKLLLEDGYEAVGVRNDLAGIERIVSARKP
jgi:release factor glutamine methyltransferase